MNHSKTQVIKDLKEKSILVSRQFDAPLNLVWRAFSDSDILCRWWAPAPWKCESSFMNFTPGGHWLYAMVGPEGERHFARMNYLAIDPQKSFDLEDLFCDENGNPNTELPVSKGSMIFTQTGSAVQVDFKMHYATAEDVQKLVEMGFEQGITMALDQLESLLQNQAL